MPGGTGQTFDWKIIKNFSPNKSFFLSGGLNTNNISEALDLKKTEYFDVLKSYNYEIFEKSASRLASAWLTIVNNG